MPSKKSKKPTASKSQKPALSVLDTSPMVQSMAEISTDTYRTPSRKRMSTKAGIILLVIILAAVLLVRKGYIVAAVVNGRPIFTWTLNQSLLKRFGKQQLEGMITEQLIYQETQKAGVTVTKEDVDRRESEMVKSVGTDVKLEDLLKFQGMTREDFDSQVKLQLSVEKLLGKEVSFTDAQLDNYIATNSAMFTATDSAAKRVEAKKVLMDQEINAKVQPWLTNLKEKAKILRLL